MWCYIKVKAGAASTVCPEVLKFKTYYVRKRDYLIFDLNLISLSFSLEHKCWRKTEIEC